MAPTIQHLVVLMLENRSFDHMLGFMRSPSYPINGLTGSESNPRDPAHIDPSQNVKVSDDAGFIFSYDPGHNFPEVNLQLFDNPAGPPATSVPNGGFILSYSQQPHVTPGIADTIMKCMAPTTIPVLSTLAAEFAICDAWYSSVPGPTWPNRFFVHAATSKGYLDNSQFRNYDMPSIFENLAASGFTWRDYYHDFSQTWALQRLQTPVNKVNFYSLGQFHTDARNGKLPNYAFIEPKYFSFFGEANDQHPPHDIRAGEALIADVYNSVRNSPQWEQTLLVILHDEHGGMYDHVTPPAATPPDAYTSLFAFDRFGLRVPAVLVSPFIPKGTIDHRTFDHTSIPATLKQIFNLPSFLTKRDAAAQTFSDMLSLTTARTDAPQNLSSLVPAAHTLVQRPPSTPEEAMVQKAAGQISTAPLSDFQQALVALAHTLDVGDTAELRTLKMARRIETEYDAAVYVREVSERYAQASQRGGLM
ncbi:MAG: alkaline phosphatase family protein [Bryobacteraceae bacterium]